MMRMDQLQWHDGFSLSLNNRTTISILYLVPYEVLGLRHWHTCVSNCPFLTGYFVRFKSCSRYGTYIETINSKAPPLSPSTLCPPPSPVAHFTSLCSTPIHPFHAYAPVYLFALLSARLNSMFNNCNWMCVLSLTLPPLFSFEHNTFAAMLDTLPLCLPFERQSDRTWHDRNEDENKSRPRVGNMEIRDLRVVCLFEDVVL